MNTKFKYKRFKASKIIAVLGVAFIVAATILVFFWETRGREHFLYKQVIVMASSVEAGTIVTADMLDVKRIDEGNIIEEAIVDKSSIIGKKTAHFIPGFSQLNQTYFEDENIVLKTDEYIFTIPEEWIITLPNSLRSGDIIYFYPVKMPDEKYESKEAVGSVRKVSEKDVSDISKEAVEDYILESVVAYLKDSGNREVVTVSEEERYDGSSKIASLEIIAELEDISYLQNLAENNYKFIILYKDSQI